ncbi:LPS export ABC transporter periplasmic protein LptC [Segetibacter sp.]|uniref:LPS export ABC transporter periplasmic protein LptC n=1 Tax=Segetibacter sp. TaxID=2231182 RepID=UPI002632F7C6|nr:LPS export ABC transporter periplasmic protein LptC [Segetibacter sp.]
MNKRLNKLAKSIAVITIGCFFVWSCENDIRDVQNLNKKVINVEEARQIESYLSENGKVKAKLTAPLMLSYQKDTPKIEFPKSLHVDFYNDSTKIESKLSAKYGRYLQNENKVYLRDSVVVFNMKGDTLLCKELYWDQARAVFYSDKKVIIRKPDSKIYGEGMIADQNFKWFTITKPHNSYLNIPDSSFLSQ